MTPLPNPLAAALDQLAEQIAQRVSQLQNEQKPRVAEDASPWMGIERTARYLDLPKQRVYKLTAAGAIPHYKQGGRLLFHQTELDHWLHQHAAATNAQTL